MNIHIINILEEYFDLDCFLELAQTSFEIRNHLSFQRNIKEYYAYQCMYKGKLCRLSLKVGKYFYGVIKDAIEERNDYLLTYFVEKYGNYIKLEDFLCSIDRIISSLNHEIIVDLAISKGSNISEVLRGMIQGNDKKLTEYIIDKYGANNITSSIFRTSLLNNDRKLFKFLIHKSGKSLDELIEKSKREGCNDLVGYFNGVKDEKTEN